MKRYKSTKKMKRRFVLLAGAVLVLIFAIVFHQCSQDKEKRKYREYQKQQSTETEKKASVEPKEGNATASKTKNMDTTLGIPASALKKNITAKIKNLDTYASKLMGNGTDLLNYEFSQWLKEQSIAATSGSIFYVLVPDNDPGSTEFFVHIDDSKGSLVMLAYHIRENVVTVSDCNQTEKEIKAGVFEKNGPSQCDISETEDAKIRNNQEGTNATK